MWLSKGAAEMALAYTCLNSLQPSMLTWNRCLFCCTHAYMSCTPCARCLPACTMRMSFW